MVMAAELWNEE